MIQVMYCLNNEDPPSSLKILVLDSALVLWRKGEKDARETWKNIEI